jgi:hypothetical protein
MTSNGSAIMSDVTASATKEGNILVTITTDDRADATAQEVRVELTIKGAQKLKSQIEAALVAVGIPAKPARARRAAVANPNKSTEGSTEGLA